MVRKESYKTYILDTTVLIGDPDIFYKIAGEVIIPFVVLRELDGLKNSDHVHIARAARKVSRTLDRLGSYNDLTEGAKLSTGAVLKIVTVFDPLNALASDADNRIVGTALKLQREGIPDIALVSTDDNMRIAAKALGLKAEYWPDCELEGQVQMNEGTASAANGGNRPLKREHRKIVIALILGTVLPFATSIFLGSSYNVSEGVLDILTYVSMAFGAVLFIGGFSGLLGGEGTILGRWEKPRGLDIRNLSQSSSPNADLTKDGSLHF
jgi:predicted ribonuclease YlaK